MNDLALCLEVISRSRQPLRYIRRWMDTVRDRHFHTWFQRYHQWEWAIKWMMTSRDPKGAVRQYGRLS